MARKTTSQTKNKPINFEKSLKQLETLVEKLEKGELSLEQSLKEFEQGIKLTRECRQALQNAEQKITLLSQKEEDWVKTELKDGDLLESN